LLFRGNVVLAGKPLAADGVRFCHRDEAQPVGMPERVWRVRIRAALPGAN
jgi:hypothetical protein